MHQTHSRPIAIYNHRMFVAPAQWRLRTLVRSTAMALVMIGAGRAHADSVFDVDTDADLIDDDTSDGVCHTTEGTCSLRAAIMQSNHPAAGITVIHLPAGNYRITIPAEPVNDETVGNFNFNIPSGPNQTVILGAGPSDTIVDGNGLDNVFRISGPRSVTFDGMTVRNGVTPDIGGGINSEGLLTVKHCVIENNSATLWGGGIHAGASSGSTLAMSDTIVRSNAAALGGGIYTQSEVVVRNSELDGNRASDSGGGIYNKGQLTLTNSTISANVANTNGGGIYSNASAFLYNTTIVDNDADHDRDMLGGIGGGLFAEAGARFVVVNTLFARNTIDDAPLPDNCNGTFEVYGINLFDDVLGCTFTGNGAIATGPISPGTVGPLQDNGGPTPTHALLDGSEAIDATNVQGCVDDTGELLPTDQRGFPRVAGERCDVGAYESGSVDDIIFADGFD